MLYLLSFRKYFFILLRVVLFFTFALLIYAFYISVSTKFAGQNVLAVTFSSFFSLLASSLPYIAIFSSCLYLAEIVTEKALLYRMIPITSAFNTILFIIFFIANFNYNTNITPKSLFYSPGVRSGYINSFGDYKFYIGAKSKNVDYMSMNPQIDSKKKTNSIKIPFLSEVNVNDEVLYITGDSVLFYNGAYILNGLSLRNNSVIMKSAYKIGAGTLYNNSSSFSVSVKEPAIQIKETGITKIIYSYYLDYLKKLKEIFLLTYRNNNIIVTCIAIFLLNIGFLALICGVCGFAFDKKMPLMTFSALFIISTLFFMAYPYFLGFINLIKFGIRNNILNVILPGLMVGSFASFIGYGLIELNIYLKNKYSG